MAKQRTAPVASADQHNIIGAGSTVEGTLRAGGNVHVSGTVNGNVEVDGRTVVMQGGVIDGELTSTSAEIAGRVKGQVRCSERLVLKPTAMIDGDIQTAKLVIEDGATFNGRCEMGASAGNRTGSRGGDQRRVLSPEAKDAA
ncbi:MAG TPA: polymer-forming cytoskeletal protein [Bacteroidetes bacterium]|nr:polymer-forming cytoskeletal protein [Bacteroidota bacterium]HIL58184.1 polymer-forming cytoskeletal protein [Rhodothermales bacterium]